MHRSSTGRRRSSLLALATVLALSVILPATASAAFHLTKVTEVYPGTTADPDSAFIELQAFAAGQNFVANHEVTTYNAAGSLIGTFTFPGNAPNGQDQRTILIGDGSPPGGVAKDFTFPTLGGSILAGGGAACFDAQPVDCVTWGNYAGAAGAIPGPASTPVAPGGIPGGNSIVRSIAPGCATLLEPTDDTDNSASDFALATDPNPRPNTVAPTERPCAAGAPQTLISKGPKKKIKGRTAKFKFSSPDPGVTFECRLDKKPYKACASPFKVKRIKLGKHVFSVRAIVAGTPDGSPAIYKFKRKKPKK